MPDMCLYIEDRGSIYSQSVCRVLHQLLGHDAQKGAILTVIVRRHWFLWLAPFSACRCIIRLCLLGPKRSQPAWVTTAQGWGTQDDNRGIKTRLSTHTYFGPLVIGIGLRNHLHLGKQRNKRKALAQWRTKDTPTDELSASQTSPKLELWEKHIYRLTVMNLSFLHQRAV